MLFGAVIYLFQCNIVHIQVSTDFHRYTSFSGVGFIESTRNGPNVFTCTGHIVIISSIFFRCDVVLQNFKVAHIV